MNRLFSTLAMVALLCRTRQYHQTNREEVEVNLMGLLHFIPWILIAADRLAVKSPTIKLASFCRITLGSILVLALGLTVPVAGQSVPNTSKNPALSSQDLAEQEELVYRNPFDAKRQIQLARTAWHKFEISSKTDSVSASESATAYLAAWVEGGNKSEFASECEGRLREMAQLSGQPSPKSFDTWKKIYLLLRPNFVRIIKLRNDFEKVWNRKPVAVKKQPEFMAAQAAVAKYIRIIYDVEVGLKVIDSPDGGRFKFGPAFYSKWENGLRSYGLVLVERKEGVPTDFMTKGSYSSPLDPPASQIHSGESAGRFRLANGDEIVPGLKYFESR